MPTAHLLLYLVDFSTALSTQVLLPRLFSGSETFLRPWQKKKMSTTLSSQRYWNTDLVQRETIG